MSNVKTMESFPRQARDKSDVFYCIYLYICSHICRFELCGSVGLTNLTHLLY